jgi:hypothetical protein
MSAPPPLHQRYLALVEQIERDFAVARWRWRDVDLWPMARMDLFLDMFRTEGGDTAPPQPPFLRRAVAGLATPLTNLWESRNDLGHWVPWPRRAYALILGDGVSLDFVDGAWEDRYGGPLIAAFHRHGHETLLVQSGNLTRLPWRHPTFAANTLSVWGALAAGLGATAQPDLPDLDAVRSFLSREGVTAPSLDRTRLARRARIADATASAFQRVLRIARPKLAFVVTYYAGLGHAFALACRRENILCVDLQHCPQDGRHKAYSWRSLPARGYTTLPALFWTWTADDAAHIRGWTDRLDAPWHQSLHGGHTQLAAYLDDDDPVTRAWDRRFDAISAGAAYDREILVALQPIGGRRRQWDALADRIAAAPANWRWWIRRHPSSTPVQDREYARLLVMRRPNVVIEAAQALPLPALLRRMSALVSLMSGAAGEAAAFGVPAFFLDPEAAGPFAGLIERGRARIVDTSDLIAAIDRAPAPVRPKAESAPPLEESLQRLGRIADDYARLCRAGSERAPTPP